MPPSPPPSSSSPSSSQSSLETTWEYETVRPPRGATMEEAVDPKDVLNDLGSDGWELIETIDYSGGGTKYLVFKRPARGDIDE